MRKIKLVIVGGVAGGASAAVRARRLSETAEIILLERGAYVSFANCGLPYHIGGEIPDRQQLLLKTPQDFIQRFNIDVRIEHQVLQIEADKKVIHVRNEQTGEIYHESYDQLLLSTGGNPMRPTLPGIDLPGVFTLRTLPDTQGLQLSLNTGEVLATGMVLLAIGLKPDTQLARSAGLVLGPHGGVQVDTFMRTSDPYIYAVGDVVETAEWVTGNAMLVPLAGPANRQGRIAAENMLGGTHRYKRSQGTSICKVFDHVMASVGLNEKTVQRLNMNYEKVYVHAAHHAAYYPGSSPVSLKLLFSPDTGYILGAQAVGKAGIDKCIDVLAVAQRANLKVQDLEDLELCYAPPFNSARDVVNQVGMLATNVINGDTRICHVADILKINPSQQCLLDVRTSKELEMLGRYPEALHIPVDELRWRLNELPKDKEILIGCQSGLRGHVAYRLLQQHGFRAKNLSGGYKTYQLSLA